MNESEKKFSLSDLVDVKLLQEFQDVFANAMNVASLTYDDKKPITKPSNFNEFCIKYIKGTELELNEEIERLNTINNNAKKLIYLLDGILKGSNSEIDFNWKTYKT